MVPTGGKVGALGFLLHGGDGGFKLVGVVGVVDAVGAGDGAIEGSLGLEVLLDEGPFRIGLGDFTFAISGRGGCLGLKSLKQGFADVPGGLGIWEEVC